MVATSFNHHLCYVTLLGNVVAKPDIRYLANPIVPIAEFVIATHKKWLDKKTNQMREWTSFHTVKMIGDAVEKSLIHAGKGDLILIKGHLVDSQKSNRQIVHATYACAYKKGFAPSMNHLHISGKIVNQVKLVTTETGSNLAEFVLNSQFEAYSPIYQQTRKLSLERTVHVWGKQAQYIAEHAAADKDVVIDGSLSYLNNNSNIQLIDAQQLTILNKYG
ncbi:single-stranded DNA-binding protein [Thalassotalea marina]|uniref:single-stranded DNA-binding protein n=1 Tax=Thalassotalea marina TaxID=1673741 RepID=UPI0016795F02|nr:single-stranded DNA-binding protein [Thalassotalea marina]